MPLSLGLGTLLGGVATGLLGGAASVFGTSSTNRANERIAADNRAMQIAENEKTREHNLHLAELQNQWNLQQYQRERNDSLADWHRENAYNSPAAQMSRYMAAGLNPNLIYGQSNTAGSLSSPSIAGSMTSGAPAVPAALTPTPSRQNPYAGLQPMFDKLGDALMSIPMYKEQVRGAALENDIKAQQKLLNESELQKRGYENKALQREDEWQEYLRMLTVDPEDLQNMIDNPHQYNSILATPRGRKLLFELNREYQQNKLGVFELDKAAFDKKLRDDTFDDLKREIKSKADISETEAEYAIKTIGYRLAKAVSDDDWYEFEKWLNVVDTGGNLISTVMDNFSKIGMLRKGLHDLKKLFDDFKKK